MRPSVSQRERAHDFSLNDVPSFLSMSLLYFWVPRREVKNEMKRNSVSSRSNGSFMYAFEVDYESEI